MKNLFRVLLIVAAGFWLAGCKAGRDVYAVTTTGTLIKFLSTNANSIDSEVTITGLDSGETLQQIDFRPNDGNLYGITSNNRVVTVDTDTGAVTLISTTPFTTDTLTDVVMDVNPQGDYLRVIAMDSTTTAANGGVQAYFNARIDPTDGAVTTADSTTVQFTTNDVNFGETPQLVAIAHTNNRSNASSTIEYGLELVTQTLVKITNTGVLTTIATVDQGFTVNAGFDIVRDSGDNDGDAGLPYVALSANGGNANFYDFNLTTADTSKSSSIGSNRQILSIAVTLDPPKRSGFSY